MKEKFSRVKKLPWSEVSKLLSGVGWELDKDRKDLKRYKRGLQLLVLNKVGKDKWKIEYFVGGKLVDSAGITTGEYTKACVAEMAMLYALGP